MLDREYGVMREVEDHHWWYGTLRDMVLRDLRPLLSALPEASILDAGCGTGGMLSRLRDTFPQARLSGIDFSPSAVAMTTARGFSGISQGSINDLPFQDASADIIISLDVLYHEGVDEAAALSGCRRVLKPGGTLILNLPAYDALRGTHDFAVSGVRRYRPAGLRRLLESAGFSVTALHAWNLWLFFPILLARQLSRFRTVREPSLTHGDLRPTPSWLRALLVPLCTLDTQITRRIRSPLGTSLYAIARRTTHP
jgi:SAM-dependent methyltransferase